MLRQMEEVGYIETPFGRRRYFPYIDRRNRHHLENVACNYPIQSLCNDIALSTAFGETGIYTAFGLPSLLFVHDFNLVEVPEKEAEDVAKYVEQIDPYPNGRVRFYPEVHIADTWGGLKNAKAAAVDIGDPTGSDGTGASDSDDREGGANDTNVDSE
jgi:DNA polymerase I-like protein with 3'-5' exonuclease and polymerase domains